MQNSTKEEKIAKVQEYVNKIPFRYLFGMVGWFWFYGLFGVSLVYPYVKRYYIYKKPEISGVRFIGLENGMYPVFKLRYYKFHSKCKLSIDYLTDSKNEQDVKYLKKSYSNFTQEFFKEAKTITLKKRYKNCYDAIIDGQSFFEKAKQMAFISEK